MPQVNCPNCGQSYEIPPEQWPQYVGRSITCTRCQRPFPVGVAAPAPAFAPGFVPQQPPPKKGNGALIGIIIAVVLVGVLVVGGGLVAILLPSLNRAREQANRAKCANNMRQISLACVMYANNYKGVFPDRLDRIVTPPTAQDVQPNVFTCPSSTDTPPSSSSSQEAADLNGSGHLSYVYVGKGLKDSAGSDAVLFYEPLTNHTQGSNFAFADCHIEFLSKADAEARIADLKRGINPPKMKSY